MAFGVDQTQIDEQLAAMRDMPNEELAQYAAEETAQLDDGHLVEYIEECVRQTEDTERDRMKLDELLWEAHENEMRELRLKDDWQAKITTNEPFTTAYQAKMLVRKAVVDKPDWFDCDSALKDDPAVAMKLTFWKDALKFWSRKVGVQEVFPDMAEMSFAMGVSLAIKVLWKVHEDGTEGPELVRIEPWKIRRDPDAMTRKPQSGLYCIHQDWVDYHVLLEGEKTGAYHNVRACLHEQESDSTTYGRRDERKRRGLIDITNRFRPAVFVREFWGDILNHNGELVLSNQRVTIANRTVIVRPIATTFPSLRWPIHQFAALPHLRNFHGMSLIEGMLKIWKLRNNILNMTTDQLSHVLNAAYEVDEHKLINPADKELYPGAMKARKQNATGSAFNLIQTNTNFLPVSDKLLQITGNMWEKGTFVTELISGENPKGGTQRTLGEIQIKTEQAMGVFEGISHDVEYGGEQALSMLQEVLTTYWDPWDHPSYIQVLGQKHAQILGTIAMMSPEQRIEAVRQDTDITIRGVSIIFQKAGLVDRLMNMVKLTEGQRFHLYAKDDVMIRKLADALDASETVKSEDEIMAELNQQASMTGQVDATGQPVAQPPMAGAGNIPPGQLGNQLMEKAMASAKLTSIPGGRA